MTMFVLLLGARRSGRQCRCSGSLGVGDMASTCHRWLAWLGFVAVAAALLLFWFTTATTPSQGMASSMDARVLRMPVTPLVRHVRARLP